MATNHPLNALNPLNRRFSAFSALSGSVEPQGDA